MKQPDRETDNGRTDGRMDGRTGFVSPTRCTKIGLHELGLYLAVCVVCRLSSAVCLTSRYVPMLCNNALSAQPKPHFPFSWAVN